MKIIFIFISFIISQQSYSRVLYIITPELPKITPLHEVKDIFSINMGIQRSKTLFIIDEFGRPQPYVAKKFKVLKKGLEYVVEIKTTLLPNGSYLRASDVKKSFEFGILKKAGRFMRFKNILGFDDFSSGKSTSIRGIKIIGAKKVSFVLNKKNPQFLQLLTDFRYPIYFFNKEKKEILGDYKISFTSDKRVELKRREAKLLFEKVIYTTECPDKPKYFLHLFGTQKKCRLKNEMKIQYRSFKNYLFHLNRETFNHTQRKSILSYINPTKFLKTCFEHEVRSKNFIPPGFAGYKENMVLPKLQENTSIDFKVRIGIAKGSANATCVKKYLEKSDQFKVDLYSTVEIIKKWSENTLDMIFWYIESEEVLDHINYFLPDNTLKLGPKEVRGKIYKKGSRIQNYRQRMSDYAQEVVDSHVTVPLFRPKEFVIISKGIKLRKQFVSSPTYLRFSTIDVDEVN